MRQKWYEFTEYQTPDGLTYRFQTHERFLISQVGFGMPPIDYISQRGPMQHGETIYDYRLRPRTIQMVIRHNACSRDDYWATRANFLNFIRPNRQTTTSFRLGKLIKTLGNGQKRAIDVIIDEGPTFDAQGRGWDERGIQDTIRFVAPDPTFYNPTSVTKTWTLSPDAINYLTFPMTFDGTNMKFRMSLLYATDSITYSGTWMSFPNITITGPISYPTIQNTTTGEQIRLNYIVAASEVVTIALPFGEKTVTSSTVGNIIGTVESTSDLANFHIAVDPEATGGINNFVAYGTSASVATAIVMTYYTRYIGI